MGSQPAPTIRIPVLLRLGRVSNLPTVWSNVLAGVALAGGTMTDPLILPLMLAMFLFYTGGMFLNDAFDWKYDSAAHPERPIPRHEITASQVFLAGYLLLAGGVCMLAGIEIFNSTGIHIKPVLGGLALAGFIVFYNWHHKANPFSPVIMGLCRMMVYFVAALSISHILSSRVFMGGLMLFSWIIGLTYIAKQETLGHLPNLWPLGFLLLPLLYTFPYTVNNGLSIIVWLFFISATALALYRMHRREPGDMSRAVALLIAAISLLDSLFVLQWEETVPGVLALAGFPLTLIFHRFIAGT